jgi:hypothetical protein
MSPEDLDILWQQVAAEDAAKIAAEIQAAWAQREAETQNQGTGHIASLPSGNGYQIDEREVERCAPEI